LTPSQSWEPLATIAALKPGLTRWDMPFHLAPATHYLFEEEFQQQCTIG
jgi:hypothetical protein